jgi:hypothetical protein
MYRTLAAAALLTMSIAAPMQDAAAQDPVGGAILGGAAGALLGGALDGEFEKLLALIVRGRDARPHDAVVGKLAVVVGLGHAALL